MTHIYNHLSFKIEEELLEVLKLKGSLRFIKFETLRNSFLERNQRIAVNLILRKTNDQVRRI